MMFGIENYHPVFYWSENDFKEANQSTFDMLIGKKFERIFWVWDCMNSEWFTDAPVLIQLEDCYVSICNTKFSDVAIGINDIDISSKLDWYGCEFQLTWKEYCEQGVENITNMPIQKIEPLMYSHVNFLEDKSVKMLNGVNIFIDECVISIFNALDCNAIEIQCKT